MDPKHLQVSRTARYYTSTEPGPEIAEIVYVLHGYGQLAEYFIKHFEGIFKPERLVVAPEALSRFYLDGVYGRVGATWMTKVEREIEIRDYVAYLDQLNQHLLQKIGKPVRITLLGFSQGCPTAWRWFFQGSVQAQHLLFCSGSLPKEDSLDIREKLTQVRLDLVYGTQDEYIDEDLLTEETARIRELKPNLSVHQFEGGHFIHRETIQNLLP